MPTDKNRCLFTISKIIREPPLKYRKPRGKSVSPPSSRPCSQRVRYRATSSSRQPSVIAPYPSHAISYFPSNPQAAPSTILMPYNIFYPSPLEKKIKNIPILVSRSCLRNKSADHSVKPSLPTLDFPLVRSARPSSTARPRCAVMLCVSIIKSIAEVRSTITH